MTLTPYEILDRDTVDRMYKQARSAALKDPGYLLEMVDAMNRQKEYRRIAEDI